MIYKLITYTVLLCSSIVLLGQNKDLSEQLIAKNNPSLLMKNSWQNHRLDFLSTNFQKGMALKTTQSKMTKVGKTLTLIGVPLAVIGSVLVAGADEYYYECNSGRGCEGDPKGAFGALALVGGIGMTVTGVVLWTKGRKKDKRAVAR